MSALTLPPSLSAIAALLSDKQLGNASLPSKPVSLSLPSQSQTVTLPGNLGGFTISANETTSFSVINSVSDGNVDGYFDLDRGAAPAAQDPTKAAALEAPIPFDPTKAYLVLTALSASGKVADQLSVGSQGALGLEGDDTLDVSMCTAFSRTTLARDAVTQAAENFKTIFSSAEVQALTPDETLSFGIQGSLSLSLKFTATSLAGILADSVGTVLNQAGPFSFSAGPSATLAVTAKATDGYRVYAQRPAAGGTQFSISKQFSTSLGIDGGLGLTVTISDSSLDSLVNSIFAQLGNVAQSDLESILQAAGGVLSDQQAAVLRGLLAKLGIADPEQSALQSLQSKLATFKSDVTSRINPTVSAQFTYSWQRLTSDSLAVQCTVPDPVLDKYLPQILRLDVTGVMDPDPADGVILTRLLGQKSREIDIGYGFSFEIGGYVFLKSSDTVQTRFVELDTQSSSGQLRQFSFLGKRQYTASWFGTSQSNYAELDASTPVPLAAPAASDFRVGLSVAFTWANLKFSEILQTVADHGVVLNAFGCDSVLDAMQSLTQSGVPSDATGTALVSLTVPDAVLTQILPKLNGPDYRNLIAPNAMARALPCTPENQQFAERAQAFPRGKAYAQMWSDFLAQESLDDTTIPILCSIDLKAAGCAGPLVSDEGQSPNNFVWSAATIGAEASLGDLQDAVVNQVPVAFRLLQSRQADFHELFADCSDNLAVLAAQNFGCRILAGMLMLAASETPGCLDGVVRLVQLSWKDAAGVSHTVVAKQGS